MKENALSYATLPAATLARLVEASQVLNSTLELELLLQFIIDTAAELTGAAAASIMLFDDKTHTLRFEASSNQLAQDALGHFEVPLEGSLAGAIFCECRPLIINDAQHDPRLYKQVGEAVALPTHSLLGVPLCIKERSTGVLEAVNKRDGSGFSETDAFTLSALASQAAIAIENARLIEALQKAHAELRQLDRAKSDFISVASHELRTPLHIILGYAEFLQGETSSTGQEYLRSVRNSAMRLKQLIESMVNLNYMDAGSIDLERTRLDLRQVVEVVIADLQARAQAQGLTLELSTPSEPLWVLIDQAKIQVAITNVMSNALQFTAPGGQVLVSCEKRFKEAWVSVMDNGPGIPPEQLERVFERFYQVEHHMTRRKGGLGLGLTIARGMVAMHAGRIWAESPTVDAGGCRVTLALPLAEA
ncbi:MAG: HAMP domain-containing histidine kinase [Thermoflexales bacterium]|nr:HAMP domain-containing histidine kinase [Thermoflexales bacterium]